MREELFGSEQGAELPALLSRANWDETDPTRDRRVVWLLSELDGICSSLALQHLCVDILRERQGGKAPPATVSIDCSSAGNDSGIRQSPDQDSRIHEQDIQFAWKGLLALRTSECADSEDSVLLLLRVLVENPELEASFCSQWPIKAIADRLNAQDRSRSWDQRRVDNAKEKLGRWIAKKKRGFDDFEDFVALLARIGRKLESAPGTESGFIRPSQYDRFTSEMPR
jgi:hypothetical protein